MKRFIMLIILPAFIQLILIPFWFLDVDYRYIDASIISLFVSILAPIYLLVVNLVLKGYRYGLIRTHLLMLAIVVVGVVCGMLGWSRCDVYKMLHPDGLTAGFNQFYLELGAVFTGISFVVSCIIKWAKKAGSQRKTRG